MDERRGDWIATFLGGRFWPLDPRPDEVHIADIAHALSCVGRFGGHARSFYSVAQHSVYVARCCGEADALWGLLHDASEAYLGDVVRPVKRQPLMRPYLEAETAVMAAVCDRFGLPSVMPASVQLMDKRVLKAESEQLMNRGIWTWSDVADVSAPAGLAIEPWPPVTAERVFLKTYEFLMSQRGSV